MECNLHFALGLSTKHELLIGLADLSAPNFLVEGIPFPIHKHSIS